MDADINAVYQKMSTWMDLVNERLGLVTDVWSNVSDQAQPGRDKLSYKAWSKLSKAEQVALARQKVRGCG